jgi:hypothetical protein
MSRLSHYDAEINIVLQSLRNFRDGDGRTALYTFLQEMANSEI